MVNVSTAPALTGFAEAAMLGASERSAAGLTVTDAVALSFKEFGSAGVDAVRVTVFVSVPTPVAFTTSVIGTVAPMPSDAIEQGNDVHGAVPDTNVPPPIVSEIVIPVAADGPLFVTTIV